LSVIFFANGAGLATWATRIPDIQRQIGIGDGALGLALFCIAAGSLASMPIVGALASRRGSATLTRVGGLAFSVSLALPPLADDLLLLCVTLFIFGACNGGLDVAMNSHAVTVESRHGKLIMSSLHGLFSLGGLFGAAMGSWFAARGWSPAFHLGAVATTALLLVALSSTRLLAASADKTTTSAGPIFGRPRAALLPLAIMAFCILLGEGALADWSALYLAKVQGADTARAAWGFAAFSLMMAAGRFTGDRLTARFGAMRVIAVGALLATTGLVLALAAQGVMLAVIGFGCVGSGYSCIFPNLVTTAAKSRDVPPGVAIASVTTAGYLGFLIGPPLIGLVAEMSSLTHGLALVALCSMVVVVMAVGVKSRW
jgi:MFS family permease